MAATALAVGLVISLLVVFRARRQIRLLQQAVAEREAAEAKLVQSRDEALRASLAKSEFLASMSHEIRAPMNLIIGFGDLLEETSLTSEQREYVRGLTAAGNTLLNLISNILDLSKIEAGRLELEETNFDVYDLVEKTVEGLEVRAQGKGLKLVRRVLPDVPKAMRGDPERLRQILVNLLGNAIKFTERGEVGVRVERESEGEGRVVLRFTVWDTGIGISADKLDSIFERFIQADSSIARKYGGSGLGLAICKRLVERMGGAIRVESRVREGSTFTFTVRLEIASSLAEPSAPRPERSASLHDPVALRILLAEDSEDGRSLVQTYFSRTGHQIDTAENGAIAIEKFKTGHYDLVLMDLQMPIMNGYDATQAIRQWERERRAAPVPIIALTALALKDELQQSLEAGCTSYLTKPVRKALLLEVIGSYAQRASA